MILNDRQLLEIQAQSVNIGKRFIDSFIPNQVKEIGDKKCISYGLTSFGYDVRLATSIMMYKSAFYEGANPIDWNKDIDPLNFDESTLMHSFKVDELDYVVIPPHGYILGHSIETIAMPDNCSALCLTKSTYARAGILCNTTPLEPGWVGQITLEIANLTPRSARVYVNQGICQVQFFKGDRPNITYSDRAGKYMNQVNIVTPKG